MNKPEITSKERVSLALSHHSTDLTPFSWGFGLQPPALIDFQHYMGHSYISQTSEYLTSLSDIRSVDADFIGPKKRNIYRTNGKSVDIWGIERKEFSYGRGSYDEISRNPLAEIKDISELNDYLWPSADWYDYTNIPGKIQAVNTGNEYFIRTGTGNIFETAWYLRGYEQMLVDLLTEPELAFEIMRRITDFYIEFNVRILESAKGMVDTIFTADDLGQQEAPLISVDVWEKLIKPHHTRMNSQIHEYGAKILYHTDGAIMDFLPGLTDMGIDILEAIQFDAKDMNPIDMKKLYGDRLCFHGGISVQSTLPFGTPQDVENEVASRIKVLGQNGGYIAAPSHAVQAGTPPENIAAFIRAAGR